MPILLPSPCPQHVASTSAAGTFRPPTIPQAGRPRVAAGRAHPVVASGLWQEVDAPTVSSSGDFTSDNEGPPRPHNGDSSAVAKKIRDYTEVAYLTGRTRVVSRHFPAAMGIDDFLHRLEIALYAYGFTGDNSIGAWMGRGIFMCVCGGAGERGTVFWLLNSLGLGGPATGRRRGRGFVL